MNKRKKVIKEKKEKGCCKKKKATPTNINYVTITKAKPVSEKMGTSAFLICAN